MKFDPDKHHRRSIRLEGRDYAQAGAYYVTLVVEGRECLFGEIIDGKMHPSEYGQIVSEEWAKSASIRAEIEIDEWVLMPNHLHAIVWIVEVGTEKRDGGSVGAQGGAPLRHDKPRWGSRPKSLSSLIQGFKQASTIRINDSRKTPGLKLWQRNYYEHIVRDEEDLSRIRFYIHENPLRWADDAENPGRVVGHTK